MKPRKVLWDEEAKIYFKQAIQYIHQESPQGAATVKKAILEHATLLASNAGLYEEDRFKIDNDGSYRAFTIYSYRITYRITDTNVLILRMRHTSQNPLVY